VSKNNVLELRKRKGLTLQSFAIMVNAREEQLLLIEKGRKPVLLNLAHRICSVLEASLEDAFPATKEVLKKYRVQGKDSMDRLYGNVQFEYDMEKAGIETDPSCWSIVYRLRGGAEGVLPISQTEKNRLWNVVQRTQDKTFVVFESEADVIILNLDHLLFCQFLFDPPGRITPEKPAQNAVRVYLTDSKEPATFGIDADDPKDEEDLGQFGDLIFMADNYTGDENETFHFTDEDGETVFLRAEDLAMLQIPLWVLEPDLMGIGAEQPPPETNDKAGHA
jgi:DNA-binding XRE family transcriptional regulator